MGNECLTLKHTVLLDLLDSTTFSSEEITNWYKVFIRDFPRCQLSIKEFKEMYRRFFPEGDSSMFAEHVFRISDTNRDGIIDFKEFLIHVNITSYGSRERKIKWTFNLYDVDGNGYISPDEMYRVLISMYRLYDTATTMKEIKKDARKLTADIFQMLDADCDGKIFLEDFFEGVKRHPYTLEYLQYDVANLHSYP